MVKITPGGTQSVLGSGTTNVHGITLDSSLNVYASDYNNNKIWKITQGGTVTIYSQNQGMNGPAGLAFDSAGLLYVSNHLGGTTVTQHDSTGKLVSYFATIFATPFHPAIDGLNSAIAVPNSGLNPGSVSVIPISSTPCTITPLPVGASLGSCTAQINSITPCGLVCATGQ